MSRISLRQVCLSTSCSDARPHHWISNCFFRAYNKYHPVVIKYYGENCPALFNYINYFQAWNILQVLCSLSFVPRDTSIEIKMWQLLQFASVDGSIFSEVARKEKQIIMTSVKILHESKAMFFYSELCLAFNDCFLK